MPRTTKPRRRDESAEATLRIIGGTMRGRTFIYNGDPNLRPMKERVREAVFNLVGPAVKGKRVFDLFAGTGAMCFEAISRGSGSAVLIERRFPNVRAIEQNARSLEVDGRVEVHAGDAFLSTDKLTVTETPWLVFCCPPYEFFETRLADMLELVTDICARAPNGSLVVVESDARFDTASLPGSGWDVRHYPPAVVAILDKGANSLEQQS